AILRPREVGCDRQPVLEPEAILAAVLRQLGADLVGTRVLPDDRVEDRLAAVAVPDHSGLALVGDPERRDVLGAGPGFAQDAVHHLARALPDLGRVVLYHPWLRVDLLG